MNGDGATECLTSVTETDTRTVTRKECGKALRESFSGEMQTRLLRFLLRKGKGSGSTYGDLGPPSITP